MSSNSILHTCLQTVVESRIKVTSVTKHPVQLIFFPQPHFFGEGIELYWFTFCALDRYLKFTDLIYRYQDGIIKENQTQQLYSKFNLINMSYMPT